MNKDPSKISNLLNFLSKMSEKIIDKDQNIESVKIREIFGEMLGIGTDQDNIFYLVDCPEFDGKSLLWYINSQNVRLLRQREELEDLSVKIADQNNGEDSEKAMNEVINNFKSGLASGVGLRDMINMIKERYPWSSSKMYIMILVSLVACLLGIGLYAFDLTTDIQFSLEMLNEIEKENPLQDPAYASIFENLNRTRPQCSGDLDTYRTCWDQNVGQKKKVTPPIDDLKITGWFAVWHCIQPFLGTFLVFLSMNYRRTNRCMEIPEGPDCLKKYGHCVQMLWKLGYLLCLLISVVPIPALTHIYMFYLNVRSHRARSQRKFRTEMQTTESRIQEYEALGTLERIRRFISKTA